MLIFETNGTRLYVPEPWIWPNKARWQKPSGDFIKSVPPVLPGDAPGTVYRVDGGITILPRAYEDRARFPQLRSDFYVFRLETRPGIRGLASQPRRTLDDLHPLVRARLGPVDEDGFRQDGPAKGPVFYGARPEDVDAGGWPVSFNCDSPLPKTSTYSWCFAERTVIDGLRIKYVWIGAKVPKAEWRRMDRRVQALVEWLAKQPEQRPPTIEN